MLKHLLLVGIGGFLGSALRFLIYILINRHVSTYFPLGTFTVNILGCLLIGLLYGLWSQEYIDDLSSRLWITGFCGGFTTFSTFSNDGVMLIDNGQFATMLFYVSASVILGFAAVYLGAYLSKLIQL
ncbi:MAG: fluoride efflux transporter CrcB [Cyclobacteriaceae bacterium]